MIITQKYNLWKEMRKMSKIVQLLIERKNSLKKECWTNKVRIDEIKNTIALVKALEKNNLDD